MKQNLLKPKISLLIIFLIFSSLSIKAQEFIIEKEIQATPVKNQAYSGTCWCFATTSFIESELLKKGKGEFNLSEMFTVRNVYKEKAITHIRMQENNFFTAGGQSYNVFFALNNFGAVPESIYSGLISEKNLHNHAILDSIMNMVVEIHEDAKNKGLNPNKLSSIDSILDIYLGKIPEDFEYNNKKYNPKSFLNEVLGFKTEDYIELTSFTHHEYYKPFCLQDKYNWASNLYYNIPLDEFMEIVDNAIENGYTVNWNGDVSEPGFNFRGGTATLNFKNEQITPELRQKFYDNQQTTVDHLMHITGIAKNTKGEKFYYVKNSWGTNNKYKGYLFMSEEYFKLKTVSITVNKEAIPENIRQKIKN